MTDRAVSPALNYVLSLAIATMLTTGLLLAGGNFVADRQEQVIRTELEVIGQQVTSDIQRADRLVTAGRGNTDVTVNQTLPDRITGTTYQIVVDGTADQIELSSTDPEVSIVLPVSTTTSLAADTAADGGKVVVSYEGFGGGADKLGIKNG